MKKPQGDLLPDNEEAIMINCHCSTILKLIEEISVSDGMSGIRLREIKTHAHSILNLSKKQLGVK